MEHKIFPHVTEKSVGLAKVGKYTFLVPEKVSGQEVGQAVRSLCNVHPTAVSLLKIPPKEKGLGKTRRRRAGTVKAIVTLKKGEKIADFIVEEKK